MSQDHLDNFSREESPNTQSTRGHRVMLQNGVYFRFGWVQSTVNKQKLAFKN